MELKSRQIIEVFKLKNGQFVLCSIFLSPRNMIYYHKQNKPYKSYRWMNEENWAAFENAIDSLGIKTNEHKNIKKSIDLNPLICLNIESINSGAGKLCQLVDLKVKEVLALKCEIVYKENLDEPKPNGNESSDDEPLRKKQNNELQSKSKRDKGNGNVKILKPDDDDLDQQITCFRISSQDYNNLTPMSSTASANNSYVSCSPPNEKEEKSSNAKRSLRHKKVTPVSSPIEDEASPTVRQRRTVSKPKRFSEFQTDYITPSTKRFRSPKNESIESPNEEHITPKSNEKSKLSKVIEKSVETPKSNNRSVLGSFGSAPPKIPINLKRNEILRKQEYQKSMKDLIEELTPPSPPKVKYLTLNDMTMDKIMSTIDEIKPELDSLFKVVSSKGYIKKHGELDHFLVMTLISHDIKAEMLKKLGEIYEKGETPKFGSHLLNALMPEWILNLFMKQYEMNREDAIKHLKAQNDQYDQYSYGM